MLHVTSITLFLRFVFSEIAVTLEHDTATFIDEQRRRLSAKFQQFEQTMREPVVLDKSKHPLVNTNFQGVRGNSNYTQGWKCDKCDNAGTAQPRWACIGCTYDLCSSCYASEKLKLDLASNVISCVEAKVSRDRNTH
jgi:hypothetical protein